MTATALCLAASLVFSPADAHLALKTAGELVSDYSPRESGSGGSRAAAYHILDAGSSVGADLAIDSFTSGTPRGLRRFCNVVAEFRGNPTGEWVVVVSHFDTKSGLDCPGANDGASTSGLLVGLAAALVRARPRAANTMLVWTDGEECFDAYSATDGLVGSRHAAARLKAEGRKVRAVICADMLGDRDLRISIPRNGSPALANIALYAAKKSGLGDRVSRSRELVRDDHVPFVEAGMKAIDLIDFEYGTAPGRNDLWHTPGDTMDRISEESLLASGRLLAAMLEVLAQ